MLCKFIVKFYFKILLVFFRVEFYFYSYKVIPSLIARKDGSSAIANAMYICVSVIILFFIVILNFYFTKVGSTGS